MNKVQAKALERARNGESTWNWPAISASFQAKGIPPEDIKPRENVFTFSAWKALGRSVKKGEHGVKVETWIEREKRDPDDPETKKVIRSFRRTTVFHVSQTISAGDRS
jgi:antirestriction factor ArdC-like protein